MKIFSMFYRSNIRPRLEGLMATFNTIDDHEYILKCKIRSQNKQAIENFSGLIQELFDDIFDEQANLDLSLKKEIIHKLWK